jgi:hypothetical protein
MYYYYILLGFEKLGGGTWHSQANSQKKKNKKTKKQTNKQTKKTIVASIVDAYFREPSGNS